MPSHFSFHLDRGIVILKTMVRPPNPHHTSKSLGCLASMAIRRVPSRWMSCPLVRDPQSPAWHNGADECLQASNPKPNIQIYTEADVGCNKNFKSFHSHHGPHALQQSSSEGIFCIFPQCQLQVSRTVPLAAESLQLIA